MSPKPKPEPDDKEQSARFIDTARQLEADENAETFEKAFTTIVPPKDKKESSEKNT